MVAPVTGTVVKIDTEEGGTNWAGGNAVKIKGECGWHYYLAHLDEIEPTLTVGQFIVAGEPIGTVGKTGNAKGTSPPPSFFCASEELHGRDRPVSSPDGELPEYHLRMCSSRQSLLSNGVRACVRGGGLDRSKLQLESMLGGDILHTG